MKNTNSNFQIKRAMEYPSSGAVVDGELRHFIDSDLVNRPYKEEIMNFGLEKKKAIVMASSKGLGKATARLLAMEGCMVSICGRDNEMLRKTAAEIETESGQTVFYDTADVGDSASLHRFIDRAIDTMDGVHILVTNAGGPPVKGFAETTDEEWHHWYDITFMSVVRAIRRVLPEMEGQSWGRIINITSVSVKAPVENLIYSNALRMAVVGLAKTLSNELGPKGITVNNVAPGYHLTDGLERIVRKKTEQGMKREKVLSDWSDKLPVRRIGMPQDLAGLITFLASEHSAYMTGTTIQVDGGGYPGTL
ncbi:MAG: SDR family oxidoreductase [Caldithrix sp.]|nr:SDR family oxidoreductase [Caldithrix sp.]